MAKQKNSYFQGIAKDFTASLKELDKRSLAVFLLDTAFFSVFLLSLSFLNQLVIKKLKYIPPMPILDPTITPVSELQLFNTTVTSVRLSIVLYVLAFFLAFLVAWIFLKSLEWSIILKKKHAIRFYLKSFLLHFLWLLGCSIVLLIMLFLFKPNVVKTLALIIGILYLHLSYIKYIQITLTEAIKKAVLSTFSIGILRSYLFLIPYAVIAIVLLAVSQLYYLYKDLPGIIPVIIFGLIIIAWLAWARLYVARVVEKIS